MRVYGTGATLAKGQTAKAIREGRLAHPRTLLCADCLRPATGYDHRDYNYPLRVDPICHGCNANRGPAIPRKGFFTEMFAKQYGCYTKRVSMQKIFRLIGLEADLHHLPFNITLEHWLPFKDALLEWEKAA